MELGGFVDIQYGIRLIYKELTACSRCQEDGFTNSLISAGYRGESRDAKQAGKTQNFPKPKNWPFVALFGILRTPHQSKE